MLARLAVLTVLVVLTAFTDSTVFIEDLKRYELLSY